MRLLIDREVLKRKIMEDDYDGDVEAGDPRVLEALVRSLQREAAQHEGDAIAEREGSFLHLKNTPLRAGSSAARPSAIPSPPEDFVTDQQASGRRGCQ